MAYVERKYKENEKRIRTVNEELKQRVTAKAAKITRYENRTKQFRHNRLFEENQRRFYSEIEGKTNSSATVPDATETQKFWETIWANPVEHNKDAEWLKGVKNQLKAQHQDQQDITIDERMLKQQLTKTSSWKAPGPDGIQGFWIKNLTALHARIAV